MKSYRPRTSIPRLSTGAASPVEASSCDSLPATAGPGGLTYDLTAQAAGHADVRIRWTMGPTDSMWTYCGWNIDDVEIWGVRPFIIRPGPVRPIGFAVSEKIELHG